MSKNPRRRTARRIVTIILCTTALNGVYIFDAQASEPWCIGVHVGPIHKDPVVCI